MLTKSDVKQIRGVVREEVETIAENRLKPIKKQMDVVEMKVEAVNNRLEKTEQELKQAITKSQEDTIEALSELMHSGYNNHEKRIRRIENHLQLPSSTS